jgi:enamine deaminase RidA (YjgF/YER057c/UK114 family)
VIAWHNQRVNRVIAPSSIAPTAARYAQAVVSSAPARILHTSGIVPIAMDGSVPESLEEQAALVWSNLLAILAEAQMHVEDIVSLTTYVVHRNGLEQDLNIVMAARDRALDGHLAASTLVTVPALARDAWLMEISLVAVA